MAAFNIFTAASLGPTAAAAAAASPTSMTADLGLMRCLQLLRGAAAASDFTTHNEAQQVEQAEQADNLSQGGTHRVVMDILQLLARRQQLAWAFDQCDTEIRALLAILLGPHKMKEVDTLMSRIISTATLERSVSTAATTIQQRSPSPHREKHNSQGVRRARAKTLPSSRNSPLLFSPATFSLKESDTAAAAAAAAVSSLLPQLLLASREEGSVESPDTNTSTAATAGSLDFGLNTAAAAASLCVPNTRCDPGLLPNPFCISAAGADSWEKDLGEEFPRLPCACLPGCPSASCPNLCWLHGSNTSSFDSSGGILRYSTIGDLPESGDCSPVRRFDRTKTSPAAPDGLRETLALLLADSADPAENYGMPVDETYSRNAMQFLHLGNNSSFLSMLAPDPTATAAAQFAPNCSTSAFIGGRGKAPKLRHHRRAAEGSNISDYTGIGGGAVGGGCDDAGRRVSFSPERNPGRKRVWFGQGPTAANDGRGGSGGGGGGMWRAESSGWLNNSSDSDQGGGGASYTVETPRTTPAASTYGDSSPGFSAASDETATTTLSKRIPFHLPPSTQEGQKAAAIHGSAGVSDRRRTKVPSKSQQKQRFSGALNAAEKTAEKNQVEGLLGHKHSSEQLISSDPKTALLSSSSSNNNNNSSPLSRSQGDKRRDPCSSEIDWKSPEVHAAGTCKPCAFYYSRRKTCNHGLQCSFCHHRDHSAVSIKQWKKTQQASKFKTKLPQLRRAGIGTAAASATTATAIYAGGGNGDTGNAAPNSGATTTTLTSAEIQKPARGFCVWQQSVTAMHLRTPEDVPATA